jgi:hypothetical protein
VRVRSDVLVAVLTNTLELILVPALGDSIHPTVMIRGWGFAAFRFSPFSGSFGGDGLRLRCTKKLLVVAASQHGSE